MQKGVTFWAAAALFLFLQMAALAQGPQLLESTLLAVKGRVEMMGTGAQVWDPAQTNIVLHAGDQLRTLESSRATLRLRDATIVNVSELTTLRVSAEQGRAVVELPLRNQKEA